MVQNLGLFCGTFNPIHLGHLLIAESARDQFKLDKVVFVTSARPPHRRSESDLLDAQCRYDMVKAAVADNEYFEASRIELDRSGPSYTAETVMHIRRTYDKGVSLNLILGGDNIRHIKEWYNADYLIEQCRFLVAPRLVYERSLVPKAPVLETIHEQPHSRYYIEGARVGIIDFPATSISSSAVRKRLTEGRSVLYMVPTAVNEILIEKKFYTRGTASSV